MAKFREGNLYIKDDKLLIGTASWALYANTASYAQSGNGNFFGLFSGSFFGDVIANDIYISESLIVTNITASGDIIIAGTVDGVDISEFSSSVSTRLTTNEGDIDILQSASSSFANDINGLQADSASFDIRLTNEEITSSALINDFTYVQSLGTNDDVTFNTIYTDVRRNYVSKSSACTLSGIEYQVECITGSFDVTLPDAVTFYKKEYSVKNTGPGLIWLVSSGSQLIDNQPSQSIYQWNNITVFSNGVNWLIT